MTDTFCTLWEVTPKAGDAIRVCNFESDLDYEGNTYTALPLEPTEVQMASGLSPDNAEITIPLVEPFTLTRLRGGYWRGARVVMTVVDYEDLEAEPARRHVGYLGEVNFTNLTVTPQYRSLSQKLNQPVGDNYSETCRHILGDGGCKKDLTAFTYAGTVTAVDSDNPNQEFTVSVVQANNWFHKGRITFSSGENDGLEEEIWQNTAGALVLFRPMAGDVQVGDSVTLVAGDDKTIQTCINKFNNAVNFGGEPYLPGRTKAFTFPS